MKAKTFIDQVEVIVRSGKTEYKRFSVADWIDNDDTLPEEADEYHGDKK